MLPLLCVKRPLFPGGRRILRITSLANLELIDRYVLTKDKPWSIGIVPLKGHQLFSIANRKVKAEKFGWESIGFSTQEKVLETSWRGTQIGVEARINRISTISPDTYVLSLAGLSRFWIGSVERCAFGGWISMEVERFSDEKNENEQATWKKIGVLSKRQFNQEMTSDKASFLLAEEYAASLTGEQLEEILKSKNSAERISVLEKILLEEPSESIK
jgi:hypothetical protein